jgi:hypothetical protein
MIYLKGNHESYMVDFLDDPSMLGAWRRLGGFET